MTYFLPNFLYFPILSMSIYYLYNQKKISVFGDSALIRCVKGRRQPHLPTGVDLMALIISRPFNTSTLIMVDFPGHKFHGHTCYLQDSY